MLSQSALNGKNLVKMVEKYPCHSGIEMPSRLIPDQLQGLFPRPRLLVRSPGEQGIEDIGHGGDPRIDGDLFPPQAVRIAALLRKLRFRDRRR